MNPTQQVDSYIESLSDWRGQKLQTLRQLIHEADPEIIEEWKWDVPIFTHKTMVCAISAFKEHVKINFFKGASLEDPQKIFNNGFDSKQHRSIDFRENNQINEEALKNLVKQAVLLNISKK